MTEDRGWVELGETPIARQEGIPELIPEAVSKPTAWSHPGRRPLGKRAGGLGRQGPSCWGGAPRAPPACSEPGVRAQ